MEKFCRVQLVTDKQIADPKLDSMYRQAAAHAKAVLPFELRVL